MTSNNEEKELFNAALEQPPEERNAFLKGACRGNEQLRQRVEDLLRAHGDASGILETEAALATRLEDAPVREGPGTAIGRYKLLQKIGEGGCGIVYMADQSEPVRRRVALKVIKLGMDTKSVIARFEAERQALALMDHPNIAKVLDAGATDTGRPYFVMELVRGVRITDYCDEAKLSTRERLDLFIQVCQAVQHAHQKGIIHRDLKPSNILVTVNDGVPVPKVIDFGIAKATNQQQLTDKTLFTAFEQFIGTPAYMSPEQAVMTSLDIDTRSDIYALGVLLYELLTGLTPFSAKELMEGGLDEIRRTIREVEPPRPSTRLSTMLEGELTTIAKHRHSEPAKLATLIRGDLDWIVMKCIEKDRNRRYETANGLASDIRRHLNNEPIVARPPSAAYRLQKMVRRNKLAVAAVAAVASVLVLGVAASTWQAIRATKAERQQSALRMEAETARGAEAEQRTIAEQRVYDSLVREARALRLARRVGYRDRVFSLLQQAAAIENAEKDFGELRREAVACLGDFVGRTPVNYTNWPPGFLLYGAHIAPLGNFAAFRLGHPTARKDALIVRELPTGKEIVRHFTDRSMQRVRFWGSNRLVVVSIPYGDVDKARNSVRANASIAIWSQGQDGDWKEGRSENLPGIYDCLVSDARTLLLVDDWSAGTVNLVDPESRAILHRIKVSRSEKWTPPVVISGDGSLLAVRTAASPDDQTPEVAIWNLDQGREILRQPLSEAEFIQSLSSDGKYLITFNTEKTYLTIYEAATLQPLNKLPDTVVDAEGGSAIIPGHNILALPTYMTREVRLVDYLRQELTATLNEPRNPHMVCFSPDGRSMLSVGVLHARLYDLADEKAKQHLKGRPDAATIALHPNLSRIAILGSDGVLSLLEMEKGDQIWKRAGLENTGLNYSNENFLMAVGSRTQEAFLFDWKSGERLLTVGTNVPGFTHDFLISPDGRYLLISASNASGGGDATPLLTEDPTLGRVSVWELKHSTDASRNLTAKHSNGLAGKYSSFVFLGTSTKVAFMDYHVSPSVYVWDIIATNAPTKLPLKPRWGFGNLAATPDGRRLWMIDSDGKLICVDAATGSRLITSSEGLDRMDLFGAAGLSISPDGSKLAINSTADRGLEIFAAATGRLMYHLPSPASIAGNYMWTSDSQQMIVNSWNADVAIWDLAEVDRILADLGLSDKGQASKSLGTPTNQ